MNSNHGTVTDYRKGCRCIECTQANRDEARRYREQYKRNHGRGYGEGRKRNRTEYTRECAHCSAEFTTRYRKARFCTLECASAGKGYALRQCDTCQTTYTPSSPSQKYCSGRCAPKPEPKPKTDRRTPLRRAYEDGKQREFFDEVLKKCDMDGDCWEWTQRTSKDGYPTIRFAKREYSMHRLSLEVSLGKPLGALAAHHTCANTKCVNPMHLEPATAANNTLEMLARNSYINRITELENAIRAIDPNHEVLNRVSLDGS